MRSKPNIWYLHPYAGGPGLGRASRPYHLAHQWKKHGAQATVFSPCFHHLLDQPQQPGITPVGEVPYVFLPSRSYGGNGLGRLYNMFEFTLRWRMMAKDHARRFGRPDMIISSSPHPYSFLATHAVARQLNARSIFEVRDLWPLSLIELAGLPAGHPLVRFTAWLEKRAYRKADAVVSLLPCTRQHMVDLGLDPGRWHYIPNGVSLDDPEIDHASPSPPFVQQALDWQAQGRVVVIYTGAFGRPNHLESLVEALARLREQGNQNIAAILVGRGDAEAELVCEIKRRGIENCIAVYDQQPKQDVRRLMQVADIGFIALRPEPLFSFGVSPNKLFDYMSAGLPILFAVEAGNDPVSEAGCGRSASPNDIDTIANQLLQLAALTKAERRAMGERGRHYARTHFSYDQLADAFLALADTPVRS